MLPRLRIFQVKKSKKNPNNEGRPGIYSMFPIKRTVFFTSVTVHKNTVRLTDHGTYPQLPTQPKKNCSGSN